MHDSLKEPIGTQGFAICPGIASAECETLLTQLSSLNRKNARGGLRHLLDVDCVADLARHPALRAIASSILGENAFAFTATLFEKKSDANWFLGWHQDIHIPVVEQLDVPGFSHWTEKDGVKHVQPPPEILGNSLAIRVDLDAATTENGSLEVLPGSHCRGILARDQILEYIETAQPTGCYTDAGGIVAMRPLLLHASSRMKRDLERRVLHFEFAGCDLPHGLRWHRRIQ